MHASTFLHTSLLHMLHCVTRHSLHQELKEEILVLYISPQTISTSLIFNDDCLVNAFTSCPCSISSSTKYLPMYPLAPVIRAFILSQHLLPYLITMLFCFAVLLSSAVVQISNQWVFITDYILFFLLRKEKDTTEVDLNDKTTIW